MHFGPFGCLRKLGAKRAELVQKFVPRSRVEIFHNERTQSTHGTRNSCFGVFCTIWLHLGPFGCYTKLSAKRAEVVQKFVPRSCVRIFRNERTRSTPLALTSCFSAFRTIWVHLGLFGCLTKLGAKWAKLVQKFVRRSRAAIFRNKHTLSTPLYLKLMFWCVSYYLGVFGTV